MCIFAEIIHENWNVYITNLAQNYFELMAEM